VDDVPSSPARRLNPTQQRVLDDLIGRRADRPEFPDNVGEMLRQEMEGRLASLAPSLGGGDLYVTKAHVAQVLQCEAYHLDEFEAGFDWSAANAGGTVSHKAIELTIGLKRDAAPVELVDLAVDRLMEDDREKSLGEWLRTAPEVEVAEVRASAVDWVTKFQDGFPALANDWRPRVESRLTATFCNDQFTVQGRVDLALGQARGNQANVLIVDFKTGRAAAHHLDDLRFYAVLETLRTGVPPFRVASYYLDSGRWHAEDVTVELLQSAARRIVDAIARIVDVRVQGREATLTPGPQCGWCGVNETCPGAKEWHRDSDGEAVTLRR